MMRLVVAAKWLVEEEHSAAAKRLLRGPYELHAPRLLASEVANPLWRKRRHEEVRRSAAGSIVEAIADRCMTASTWRWRSASAAAW